jgi:hypothetical protein
MFSGRPNPSWIVTDEAEIRATLSQLSQRRELLTAAPTETAGLGLRGVSIEAMDDELPSEVGRELGSSPQLYLALDAGARSGAAEELAERLLALTQQGASTASGADADAVADADARAFAAQQLRAGRRATVLDAPDSPPGVADVEAAEAAPAAAACQIELAPFNPAFWNTNPAVRAHNNCYNYASNKRTDTFAQPGRGCGSQYRAITCPEVTRAALCDGLHRRYHCFPETERPRYLVALVVAPGPGFVDFHWYRKNQEGFWSHKPGGTAARNTDNSGRVIADPRTCNRGPYTHFCGFFYTCRSQRIR